VEGTCPQCRVRLDFPASGIYECERCRTRFEVAVGSPRPPVETAVPSRLHAAYGAPGTYGVHPAPAPGDIFSQPQLDPSLHAPCTAHPENPAAAVCERCGDFMCRLCNTVEGRSYCPKCFDLLHSRGSLEFTQRQFSAPATTLTLGVLAFFTCFFCVDVPLAIFGLWSGVKTLREHQARPDLPGRGMTIAGIVLSVLALLVSTVQVAIWVFALLGSFR
jgi:hypothetical protein